MRYYIYISDGKVNMLGSQIGENKLRQIGRKLNIKIDFRLLGVGASVEAGSPQPSDELRIDRLRLIERSIDDKKVGSVDSDQPWIRGSLGLRWGFVDSAQQVVCFTEYTTDRVFVMGGSAKHLMGGADVDQQSHHAYSILPVLISTLLKNTPASVPPTAHQADPFEAAAILAATSTGPTHKFEFLAKRLSTGTARQGRRVVLASPLFVAMEG